MENDSPSKTGHEDADAPSAPSASELTESTQAPSRLAGGWGIALALVLLSTAAILTYRSFYTYEQEPLDPPPIMYVCAETRKTFQHTLQVGEKNPIESPFTKKRTGFPAEKCYWTKDGKQKLIPTYILLNDFIGVDEPTICPDCGRIVTNHNPAPPLGTPIEDSTATAARKDAATTQPAEDKS